MVFESGTAQSVFDHWSDARCGLVIDDSNVYIWEESKEFDGEEGNLQNDYVGIRT